MVVSASAPTQIRSPVSAGAGYPPATFRISRVARTLTTSEFSLNCFFCIQAEATWVIYPRQSASKQETILTVDRGRIAGMDPITRAAFEWYYAEYPDRQTRGVRATEADILAVAVPRVKAVFAGEVKWSEASKGDRAIWIGRPRNVLRMTHPPVDETHWENFWDTEVIGPGDAKLMPWRPRIASLCTSDGLVRLFGNTNIGAWQLCNMYIGGQLLGEQWFDIHQMYIDADRFLSRDESVLASLRVGPNRVAEAFFNDLVRGHPVGVRVQPRMDFSVELFWTRLVGPVRIRLHLEGTSFVT